MNHRRWIVALAGLGIGATACAGGSAEVEPEASVAAAAPVLLTDEAVRLGGIDVLPVEMAEWRGEWRVPGRLALDPASTHALGSIVDGRVTRVMVLPGDRVAAGQVLATIHSHEMLDARAAHSSALAALLDAQTQLDLATTVAGRTERLHAARAASLAQLEEARARLVAAESRHTTAMAEAARTEELLGHLRGSGSVPAGIEATDAIVRAPIDGVVVEAFVRPGEAITAGQPLVTVSDVSRLDLALQIPDVAARSVVPGDSVSFSVAGVPSRSWTAVVKRVSPSLDMQTRTVNMTAAVQGSTDLRPEMFATARLASATGERTRVVPAGAIQALEGDTVLIVATRSPEGLLLDPVPVRVGRRTADTAEIVSGVEPGTLAVVRGASIARAEIIRRREAGEEES